MPNILIAATPADAVTMEAILASRHELAIVTDMAEAKTKLEEQTFDLVMIAVHFDESRMFELLAAIHASKKIGHQLVICFCVRDTPLTRTMHESISVASKALGAWMYLDQHEYNVTQDPDAEMLRIIERCLAGGARKQNQARRIDVQKQREELYRLREAMEHHEWSDNVEERVVELRRNLAAVMLDLCNLHLNNIGQREQIAESRDLEDRVPDIITKNENVMARTERAQLLDETKQSIKEVQIGEREEIKRKDGRRK